MSQSNLTRKAHISYPDVGSISETPGLLLKDPYLYASAGFYGLAAQQYAANLVAEGMSDTKANAIQHSFWNALIASDSSWTTFDAIYATTAHDYVLNQPEMEIPVRLG